MLARYGTSPGVKTCPRPCRGKNATCCPRNMPTTIASLVGPKGVSMRCSTASVNSGMWYRPEPPITAIRVGAEAMLNHSANAVDFGDETVAPEPVDELLLAGFG